jgi:membrane associated rhomboid family serine protease
MHQASVGFHCPECTKAGAQKVYTASAITNAVPMLTRVLIALNVGVFLLDAVLSGGQSLAGGGELVEQGGLISLAQFQNGELLGVANGEWYRVITAGFLHYGFIHLAFNMYALYILGGLIERVAGPVRFGVVYFVSLIAGSLGALIVSPDSLTVGASGAVYGLMGAAFALERSRGIPVRNSGIIGVLVINLFITFGLSRYISVGGHIGGLVGGFLSGYILFDLGRRIRNDAAALALCGVLAAACFLAALSVAYSA